MGILEALKDLTAVKRTVGGDNWKRKHLTGIKQPNLSKGTRIRSDDFPKNQRNKLCRCGSGLKYKRCCEYDITTADTYEIIN